MTAEQVKIVEYALRACGVFLVDEHRIRIALNDEVYCQAAGIATEFERDGLPSTEDFGRLHERDER